MDNNQPQSLVGRVFQNVCVGATLAGLLVSEFCRVQKKSWKVNHSSKPQSPSSDLK